MESMKDKFTENEWKVLTSVPVATCFGVIITGMKITNFIVRLKEFAGVISILQKCNESYPNNLLIQETVGIYKDMDSLTAFGNKMDDLKKEFETSPEFKTLLEDEDLGKFMDELDFEKGYVKTIGAMFLTFAGLAKAILKKYDIKEKQEYFAVINQIAYDTAFASKEGFFGMGNRISKEENLYLEKVKAILA
jgi:hypothetical protein